VANTHRPKQVVVAYDFTPGAEDALMRAVDVACRAPHHVLHVIAALDPHRGISIEPTHQVTYDYAERIQRRISERLDAAFAGRQAGELVQVYVHARIGKPADEILRLASEVGADLVFIGSHETSSVHRLLLGSVSERVVRAARCPVMVVRPVEYDEVDLLKVFPYEHTHTTYSPPHRYSYIDPRVITRPNEWPIG
jgi:nucleotide-binding universal stress UspA family protein